MIHVKDGIILICLGPVADVTDWLNNDQAFDETPTVTIEAGNVRPVD